jgi:hypothetical protein
MDENTLRHAAMEVWGDMPRDLKAYDAEREELARLLHDRHPRTVHPAKPA